MHKFTGKKINQPPKQLLIFPVVAGTEHWPVPLFDYPVVQTATSAEENQKMSACQRKLRQRAKHRDLVLNYGSGFTRIPGGSK